jgi:hypothetical protein
MTNNVSNISKIIIRTNVPIVNPQIQPKFGVNFLYSHN